jgi:glycosyltransferase involved in cell wall biosynthesis
MGVEVNAQPIRVANIIEDGRLAGPQIRIVMAAVVMNEQVDTTVIMPVDNSEAFQQCCKDGEVEYVTFAISRITKEWSMALRYFFFSFYEIIQIALYLNKNHFDIVHVSGGAWQFKGAIAGRLAGVKVLWHLNDTFMPLFIRRVFAVISHFSDGFIYSSKRSQKYYESLVPTGKPWRVIQAPVDVDRFDPAQYYMGDYELIGKWSGHFVIGTVSNINPIKGLEVFIKAALNVNMSVPNCQFVVVGPVYRSQERYFKSLQKLCRKLGVNNIEFIGGRADVRSLLKCFDVYVCCSHYESSPMSVWEAMAMGTPVVSTDVGDVSLYVKDAYAGYIVNNGDSVGLADKLVSLAGDSRTQVKFGERARDIAANELNVSKCAELHLAAYKMINS